MNGSSSSDPWGVVRGVQVTLAGLEGIAQVGVGVALVLAAGLIIVAATPVGRAAARGARGAGGTALKLIPQTRALGALIG